MNLNFLIDPTFKNEGDITSFSKYHTPNVEIKDFKLLIDGKSFFDVTIKNKEEKYEKIIVINKNNDYTTGNLLDYDYFWKHCKLTAIDLSEQIELRNPHFKQRINVIGKPGGDNKATGFFIIGKTEETTFNVSKNSVSIIYNGNTKDYKFIDWFKPQRI